MAEKRSEVTVTVNMESDDCESLPSDDGFTQVRTRSGARNKEKKPNTGASSNKEERENQTSRKKNGAANNRREELASRDSRDSAAVKGELNPRAETTSSHKTGHDEACGPAQQTEKTPCQEADHQETIPSSSNAHHTMATPRSEVRDGNDAEPKVKRHRLLFPDDCKLSYQRKVVWTMELGRDHNNFNPLLKNGKHRPYLTVGSEEAVKQLITNGYQSVVMKLPTIYIYGRKNKQNYHLQIPCVARS